jgi:hypothetical protein
VSLLPRHDSTFSSLIIAEIDNNSSVCIAVLQCGSYLCLFCRKCLSGRAFSGNNISVRQIIAMLPP